MKYCKLLSQDMQSYGGALWELVEWYRAASGPIKPCSCLALHGYSSTNRQLAILTT